jgi:FAD/FMN-containing dehydrogenase
MILRLRVLLKGKSDYVVGGLGKDGISTLMDELIQVPFLVAICDAYGGAVASTVVASTAFPHRENDTFCIQYYTEWATPADGTQRLRNISKVYQAMRPYVSGSSYVNYCDLDIPDWATAYWGSNLPRLRQIKSIYDPDNLFAHLQSVPPVRISSVL